MKEETQKTLSDLYAIRATMSLVAENADKSDTEKTEIDRIENDINGARDKQNSIRRDGNCKLETYTYATKKAALLRQLNQTDSDLHDAKTARNHHRTDVHLTSMKILKATGIFIAIFVAAYGVTCYLSLTIILSFLRPFLGSKLYFLKLLFFDLAIALIPFLIYFFVVPFRKRKFYKKLFHENEERIMELECRHTELQNQIDNCDEKINAGEIYFDVHEANTLTTKIEEDISGQGSLIMTMQSQIPSHNEAIRTIASQSKALVDGAVRAYPVIDFRDWANVDLLIYYFETGRADNMKEALQLVDRQKQTDQITQALAMASAEISRSIHSSIVQLGGALGEAFGMLSAQLSAQHSEMMHGLDKQAAEQRAAIERQSAMQVSAQEMNAALLNKISTSSGHLAQQVDRQMKEVYHIY